MRIGGGRKYCNCWQFAFEADHPSPPHSQTKGRFTHHARKGYGDIKMNDYVVAGVVVELL